MFARPRRHRAKVAYDEWDQVIADDPERHEAIEPACRDHITLVEEREQRPHDERHDAAAPEHRGPTRARPQIRQETTHVPARGTL